ncbi:MAG: transcription antitermination factor NusB [Saprospiraceae bacterium]
MLYTMSRDQKLTFDKAMVRYHENVRKSYQMYLLNMLQIQRIAEYSEKDKERRMSKLLPTEADKAFTTKLSQNPLINSIRDNVAFQTLVRRYKLKDQLSDDATRVIYVEFAKTDEYQTYLADKNADDASHKKMLLALYKTACGKEIFDELMDDHFAGWVDDRSLIVGAVKKTIKALPTQSDFHEVHRPTDETFREFGEALFRDVYENDKVLLSEIEPVLKNWDADRVAIIDMILLKMALSELMNFPTIPTKVTLNEFVEISKSYSTDKSKDFINGILDRLMKKLEQDGKINKQGRGLNG